jgi:uncharacterized protein YodC (DUF2158 family)
MEFKIGDVVQLKSGGPEMTVENIVGVTTSKDQSFMYKTAGHSDGELICKWFSGSKLETGMFKPETVDKIDD